MSNSRIQETLLEIKHEHESIKDKISKLLEHAQYLENEYVIGNTIKIKRVKGED